MKTFKLDGVIATFDYDGEFGKFIGPKSVANWLHSLKEGEEAEIEVNSCGGSVVAGLAIANGIKNSKATIRAHIVGLAASMASVIACACDKVLMEEGSLVMIHDPWCSGMEGNAEDLRKEADVLDSMKAACMGFYRSKFDLTEDEISALMSEESWWNGRDAQAKKFKCEVIASDVKLCACVCGFKDVPEEAKQFIREGDYAKAEAAALEAEAEAREQAKHEALEATVRERIAAAMKSRDTEINELKAKLAEADDRVAKAMLETVDYGDKCEELKTVRQELADKTQEFQNQLSAKDQELTEFHDKVTSLTERAEKAEREFAQTRDQLAELTKAHASLMGGVLTPTESAADAKKREIDAAKSAEEREAIRAKYRRSKK